MRGRLSSKRTISPWDFASLAGQRRFPSQLHFVRRKSPVAAIAHNDRLDLSAFLPTADGKGKIFNLRESPCEKPNSNY